MLYPLACELSACGSYVWRLGNVLMITVTIINGFIHCSHSLEAPLTLLPATVRAARCLCPYVPPRLGPPQLTHHRTAWQVWEGMCWRPLLRVRLKPVKQRGFEGDYTYAKLHSKTDVFSVLCSSGVPRNLRNDLLVAADSITNTMSSLVKELHSG